MSTFSNHKNSFKNFLKCRVSWKIEWLAWMTFQKEKQSDFWGDIKTRRVIPLRKPFSKNESWATNFTWKSLSSKQVAQQFKSTPRKNFVKSTRDQINSEKQATNIQEINFKTLQNQKVSNDLQNESCQRIFSWAWENSKYFFGGKNRLKLIQKNSKSGKKIFKVPHKIRNSN